LVRHERIDLGFGLLLERSCAVGLMVPAVTRAWILASTSALSADATVDD